MMLTLVIILIVVTVAYVVAAAIKEKAIPESISAIVYTLYIIRYEKVSKERFTSDGFRWEP